MSERDKIAWQKLKADPARYAAYRERKRLSGYSQLKRHRARNLARGVCIECGKPLLPTNKRYCEQHSKYYAAIATKWRANNPEKTKKYHKEWTERSPEKRSAHWAVWKAQKTGILVKPSACQECSSVSRLHAHHEDYSKKLEVVWLCHRCHMVRHHSKA